MKKPTTISKESVREYREFVQLRLRKRVLEAIEVVLEEEVDQALGCRSYGCLRCLLLVMCTHPFAKKALTPHLARSEGHERYFGSNLMHRKVLASSHQHVMAEAPVRLYYWTRRDRNGLGAPILSSFVFLDTTRVPDEISKRNSQPGPVWLQ